MPKRPAILKKIIEEAKLYASTNKRLLAIFDLDSTLFDVSPRIAQILREFAADPKMRSAWPEETHIIRDIEPHPDAYGIRISLERAGIKDPNPEFKKSIIDYWRKYFFANEHLRYDVPYPGAAEYVRDLQKAGGEIIYLTGRDVPRMLQGTIEQLKTHGFPLDDQLLVYSPPESEDKLYTDRLDVKRGHLYLKPDSSYDDAVFKKDFFIRVDHAPGPVWFFENEPANIHLVLEHCPHIQVLYVETVHSGAKPPPGKEVPRITRFVEG